MSAYAKVFERPYETLSLLKAEVERALHSRSGSIREARGVLLRAPAPDGEIGHLCRLMDPSAGAIGEAEIVGFVEEEALLAPFCGLEGVSRRTEVMTLRRPPQVRVSGASLGALLNWRGDTLHRFARPCRDDAAVDITLSRAAPNVMARRGAERMFRTGVRVIDGLLTVAEGQRVGVYGAAGSGKSTLMDLILRAADVDIVVLALIGERGREVIEAVERISAGDAASRTCVFAATSDRPPVEKLNAAYAATGAAEFFRDKGLRVLLVMDSVTRLARAMRDIGLARGEPPARRGFPPSVFGMLPPLLERSGATATGSITAFYTVLLEGEASDDPIAEETKSILDGHIMLSPALAAKGRYPAVDVLASASRSMRRIVDEEHWDASRRVIKLMAGYAEIELLLRVGEYERGGDAASDAAVDAQPAIQAFLEQKSGEEASFETTLADLMEIGSP